MIKPINKHCFFDRNLYHKMIQQVFVEVRSLYPYSIHPDSFPITLQIHILFTLIHSQYSSPPSQIQDFPRGRKISPPPPAFRKIGDRLLTKQKIGRGKGQQRFPPALVSSKRGKDGYTFRQVQLILTQF